MTALFIILFYKIVFASDQSKHECFLNLENEIVNQLQDNLLAVSDEKVGPRPITRIMRRLNTIIIENRNHSTGNDFIIGGVRGQVALDRNGSNVHTAIFSEPYYQYAFLDFFKRTDVPWEKAKNLRVYEVIDAERVSIKSNPMTPVLEHADLQRHLKLMHANGYSLHIDSGLDFVGAGGLFSPMTKRIIIPSKQPWHVFLHEFQHLQFNLVRQVVPYEEWALVFEGKLPQKRELLERAANRIGFDWREYVDFSKRGIPRIAADETIATRKQIAALRKAGYKYFYKDRIFSLEYGLKWQKQELEVQLKSFEDLIRHSPDGKLSKVDLQNKRIVEKNLRRVNNQLLFVEFARKRKDLGEKLAQQKKQIAVGVATLGGVGMGATSALMWDEISGKAVWLDPIFKDEPVIFDPNVEFNPPQIYLEPEKAPDVEKTASTPTTPAPAPTTVATKPNEKPTKLPTKTPPMKEPPKEIPPQEDPPSKTPPPEVPPLEKPGIQEPPAEVPPQNDPPAEIPPTAKEEEKPEATKQPEASAEPELSPEPQAPNYPEIKLEIPTP